MLHIDNPAHVIRTDLVLNKNINAHEIYPIKIENWIFFHAFMLSLLDFDLLTPFSYTGRIWGEGEGDFWS